MSELETNKFSVPIRKSAINVYREAQISRIANCLIVAPACIYTGIRYRKELPAWLSISLVVIGGGIVYYNGRSFWENWRQDGKVIREAFKNHKKEMASQAVVSPKGEPVVEKKAEKPPKTEEKIVIVTSDKPTLETRIKSDINLSTGEAKIENGHSKNGKSDSAISEVNCEVEVTNRNPVIVGN